MSFRRKRTSLSFEIAQDPGKDLFAYLFLLIMVFSFMLLMTTEEKRKGQETNDAPQQHLAGKSSGIVQVLPGKIGNLVRHQDQLYLSFEGKRYHPATDLDQLETDQRITTVPGPNGKPKKLLYIAEEKNGQVLLAEYLNAFQQLNQHGISVAFAKQLK